MPRRIHVPYRNRNALWTPAETLRRGLLPLCLLLVVNRTVIRP